MDASFDYSWLGVLIRACTVLFGLGIVLISSEAWRRRRKQVLLFVALAFLMYTTRAGIGLAEKLQVAPIDPFTATLAEILDLVTLLLIFFAAVKE